MAALLNDKAQRKTLLQDIQRRIVDAAVWIPLLQRPADLPV